MEEQPTQVAQPTEVKIVSGGDALSPVANQIAPPSQPAVVVDAVTPVSKPVMAWDEHGANKPASKFGLLSLLSGVVFAASQSLIAYRYVGSSTGVVIAIYSVIGVLAFSSLLLLSIPSFKKQGYPNIMGLIGLVLNVYVVTTCTSLLLTFLAVSTYRG